VLLFFVTAALPPVSHRRADISAAAGAIDPFTRRIQAV
jgi:hypothetical protein